MCHDGHCVVDGMVAAAVAWPPVCLAVAHNSDQCVSDLCGFCLFLCADISGFHDFRSVDGAQGSVVVSFMCGALFFGEKICAARLLISLWYLPEWSAYGSDQLSNVLFYRFPELADIIPDVVCGQATVCGAL